MKIRYLSLILLVLFSASCGSKKASSSTAFTNENYVNAIIEISSENHNNLSSEEITNVFDNQQKKDANTYLQYIGNYGYITGTATNTSENGDGLPVDILVISKKQPTNKIVVTKPIALLKLVNNGILDYKVISISSKPSGDLKKIANYQDLQLKFPEIAKMVEIWFKNYETLSDSDIVGWGNEEEAVAYIKANIKS